MSSSLITADDLLAGRIQASDRCRLVNPVFKFFLVIMTLYVGTLFIGWPAPADGTPAFEQYADACEILSKYVILITAISLIDLRPHARRRTLALGLILAALFLALESLDPTTIKNAIGALHSSWFGFLLEPLQLLVFVNFIAAIPLIRLASSRDVLVFARLALVLLIIASFLFAASALSWLREVAGDPGMLFGAFGFLVILIGLALTPRIRRIVYWTCTLGVAGSAFMYFFITQTLGPRLPIPLQGAVARWRLLRGRGLRQRLDEWIVAFAKLLAMQLEGVVSSAVSLLKERGILDGWSDPLMSSLEAEDVTAAILLVFAFIDGLRGLFEMSLAAIGYGRLI